VKAALNGEIVADLTQAQAEAVTGRIREWVKRCPVGDIKTAFFGRVWLGMGYESWTEWCDCELDGFMLPTPERREVVEELSEAGMSNRAIADVVGVSKDTVGRDLSTVSNATVDTERKTIGKDGKARSQRKEPAPAPPPPAPPPVPQKQIDQAHSEANVVNAFANLVRSTFTEENMREMTPEAKRRLISLLEHAITVIKKGMQ
jgi:hypothetical protein